MRNFASVMCLIGAVGATCVFLGPGFHVSISTDGQTNRLTSVHYMGFALSPWWDYKQVVVNEQPIESEFNIHPLSVSWLFLLAAVILFAAWQKTTLVGANRDAKAV